MTEVLDTIYQLRVLRGRCEAGVDLDMDAIDRMTELEHRAAQRPVDAPATLRNRRFTDEIRLTSIGASRIELAGCPWVDIGTVVELVIEVDSLSYRFKMHVVSSSEDDNGDLDVSLSYVGTPVLLRRGPKTRSTAPSVEAIPVAA